MKGTLVSTLEFSRSQRLEATPGSSSPKSRSDGHGSDVSDGCGGTNSLGAAMVGTVATAAKVAGTAPGGSWEVAMGSFGEQIPVKKERQILHLANFLDKMIFVLPLVACCM